MAKIITLGEIMMRLQPVGYKRFMQADSFEIVFGGGEANVAVSLAQFGEDVAFVSKLPKNALGDKCIKELRGWGVDTSYIARGGDRIGIYFCEKGCSQRGSNVIYDRAGSSIATADKKDFDVDKILNRVEWLHWTGITPAASDSLAEITEMILKKFPKCERFALASQIKLVTYEGMEIVIRAFKMYDKTKKLSYLNELDVKLKMLKVLIRISYKAKYITVQNYRAWSNKLFNIGNLTGGWINSCLKV